MKKSVLLLIAVFFVVLINAQEFSLDDYKPVKSVAGTYYPGGSNRNDTYSPQVLLIHDFTFCDLSLTILTDLGATVTVITSEEVGTVDFNDFCLIVLEPFFPYEYDTVSKYVSEFEAFVGSGGTLEVHAGSVPLFPPPAPMMLPGGVVTNYGLMDENVVIDPMHPIINGEVPSPFTGEMGDMYSFLNLPPGTVIITQNALAEPTTIEYTFGSGLITATGLSYEVETCFGFQIAEMLPNNLEYSLNTCAGPIPPVPVAPWAIAIAIGLILGATILRYKTR